VWKSTKITYINTGKTAPAKQVSYFNTRLYWCYNRSASKKYLFIFTVYFNNQHLAFIMLRHEASEDCRRIISKISIDLWQNTNAYFSLPSQNHDQHGKLSI